MTDTQASQRHAGSKRALEPSTATRGRKTSTEASARAEAPAEPLRSKYGSELEAILANRIAMAGLPEPKTQFRFCPPRRWLADFAYPAAMLLIEADGGTWSAGRHVRGKGFEDDCEKTSTAAAIGWRVIRVTREMIEDGRAVALIRRALETRG